MDKKYWWVVIAIGVIGVLFFWGIRTSRSSSHEQTTSLRDNQNQKKSQDQATSLTHIQETNPEKARIQNVLNQSHLFLDNYGNPDTTPEQDLALLQSVFHLYHSYLKERTLLPASNNKGIVRTLMGENALNLEFIRKDFKYLNQEGELVDRWQTPLFFHFRDIKSPEIRSAGKDKELWSNDDLLLE